MSEEQEQKMEADILGAVGGKPEGEVIFELNLPCKAQTLGDGGDVPIGQDHLSKKSERDDEVDSNRSNSSRNKSDSPGSKKSSKRKRKNRRRREKKAAAAVKGAEKLEHVLGSRRSSKDEGTGTENEYSRNSEDVNKDGEDTETGTESETTFHDMEIDQDLSSICVEPSPTTVSSIPEDFGDSMMEIADYISSSGTSKEVGEPSVSGRARREPTHSVETLLQIAKCRILSRILEPLSGAEENDTSTNEGSFIIPQDLNSQDEQASSKLVVPPCSPSSLHSVMSNMENSLERSHSVSPTRQKSGGMKNVHFDEGPPEVVPKDESEHVFHFRLNSEEYIKIESPGAMKNVHFDEGPPEVGYAREAESELIFELNLDTVGSDKCKDQNDQSLHSRKSSKEAIILAENLAKTASATSSVASGASASSLLKGTGCSNEDFVESSYHYPSMETMNESSDNQNARDVPNKIDSTESFRETIQIFKIQNPAEAKYIGNEVDSILTKSLDKFSDLMGSNFGEDDDKVPIFAPEQRNVTPHEFASEKESKSQVNECSEEFEVSSTQEDLSSAMNTTFTIENDQQPTSVAAFRPFSPGEIMPQAIPDMVSDTESVGTTSAATYLSMVPEEEETEDEVSSSQLSAPLSQKPVRVPSQTVSSASTVIENVASVLVLPNTPREAVDTTIDIHEIVSSTSGAVSETESAKDNEIKHEDIRYERNVAIANIPSSASSTKSSISSPPSQEKSFGTAAPSSRSRPSSWGNVESDQTDSEYEAEEDENAGAKQSVEVFTLHFLNTDAPPSENNLDSGNGDQPYFNNRLNEMVPGSFGSAADNMAAIPQHRREKISGVETDTESECSWLPDRKESLLQVINERETFDNTNGNLVEVKEEASGAKKSGKRGTKKRDEPLDIDEENRGNDNQGCSCARCVIV